MKRLSDTHTLTNAHTQRERESERDSVVNLYINVSLCINIHKTIGENMPHRVKVIHGR